MALDFKGGKATTLFQEYNERRRYRRYMDTLKERFSIRDTLYDHKYYGFLNKKYQIIQPISGTDVVNFGNYAPDVFGLNYVVDQFNEFREFYLNFSNESGLQPPDLVRELIPQKSFENFNQGFQRNASSTVLRAGSMISSLMSSRQRQTMLNPVEFYNRFNEDFLFSPLMEAVNISKSGYAISSKSSVYETGIYIDLAQNTPVNLDYEKGRMLEDPGFLCYITFATEYGFSIDFNSPWRLVLNMEHPKTMENILNGRPMQDYWDFYYDQYVEITGYSYDYYNIRELYEAIYKEYYKRFNNLSRDEMSRINWPSVYGNLYEQAIRNTIYGPGQFWVEIFVLNRMRESGIIMNYSEFDENRECLRIREHALEIYGTENTTIAGRTIENQVSTGKVGEIDTGVSAYVTEECGHILKRKLTEKIE